MRRKHGPLSKEFEKQSKFSLPREFSLRDIPEIPIPDPTPTPASTPRNTLPSNNTPKLPKKKELRNSKKLLTRHSLPFPLKKDDSAVEQPALSASETSLSTGQRPPSSFYPSSTLLQQKKVNIPKGEKTIAHTTLNINYIPADQSEQLWNIFDKSKMSSEELPLPDSLVNYAWLYKHFNNSIFKRKGAFSFTPNIIEHGLVNLVLALPFNLEELHKGQTQFLLLVYASTSALAYSLLKYANSLNIKLAVMSSKYKSLHDLLKVSYQIDLIYSRNNKYEFSSTLRTVELICLQVWIEVMKELKLRDLRKFNVNDIAECHVNMMIGLIQYLTSCREKELEAQKKGFYHKSTFDYENLEPSLINAFSKIIVKHIHAPNFVKNLITFNYPRHLHFSKVPGNIAFALAIIQVHKQNKKISSAPTMSRVSNLRSSSEDSKEDHLLEQILAVNKLIERLKITKTESFYNIYDVTRNGELKSQEPNKELSQIMHLISNKIYQQVGIEHRLKTTPLAITFLGYYIQGLHVFRSSTPDSSEPTLSSYMVLFNFVCMWLVNGFKKLQAWMLSNNEKYEKEYKRFKHNLEYLYSKGCLKVKGQQPINTLLVTPSFKIAQFIIASAWQKVLNNKDIDSVFSPQHQALITLRIFNPLIEFLLTFEAETRRQLVIPKNKVEALIDLFAREIELVCSKRYWDRIKNLTPFKTVVVKDLGSSTILNLLQQELGDYSRLESYLKDTTPFNTRKAYGQKHETARRNLNMLEPLSPTNVEELEKQFIESLTQEQKDLFNAIEARKNPDQLAKHSATTMNKPLTGDKQPAESIPVFNPKDAKLQHFRPQSSVDLRTNTYQNAFTGKAI